MLDAGPGTIRAKSRALSDLRAESWASTTVPRWSPKRGDARRDSSLPVEFNEGDAMNLVDGQFAFATDEVLVFPAPNLSAERHPAFAATFGPL